MLFLTQVPAEELNLQVNEPSQLLRVPSSILGEIASLLGHVDYKALAGTCTAVRETLLTAPTISNWLLRCNTEQALLTAAVMGWVPVVRWLATVHPTQLQQQGFAALMMVCVRRCSVSHAARPQSDASESASLPMLDALLQLGAHQQTPPCTSHLDTILGVRLGATILHVDKLSRGKHLLLLALLCHSNTAGALLSFFDSNFEGWCMDDETCGKLLDMCVRRGNVDRARLVMKLRPTSASKQTTLLLHCCSSGRQKTLTALLQHFLPYVRLTKDDPEMPFASCMERNRAVQQHQLGIGVDPVVFSRHLQECVGVALQSGFLDLYELLMLQRLEEIIMN